MINDEFTFYVGGLPNGEGLTASLDEQMATFASREGWGWTYFHRTAVEAFRVGGHQDHGGEAWKPLAASTIKSKSAKGRGEKSSPAVGDIKILVDTGAMRRLGLDTSALSGVVKLVLSSPADYARFHQEGRGVPQRKVIDLTKKDIESAKAYVAELLTDSIGGDDVGK